METTPKLDRPWRTVSFTEEDRRGPNAQKLNEESEGGRETGEEKANGGTQNDASKDSSAPIGGTTPKDKQDEGNTEYKNIDENSDKSTATGPSEAKKPDHTHLGKERRPVNSVSQSRKDNRQPPYDDAASEAVGSSETQSEAPSENQSNTDMRPHSDKTSSAEAQTRPQLDNTHPSGPAKEKDERSQLFTSKKKETALSDKPNRDRTDDAKPVSAKQELTQTRPSPSDKNSGPVMSEETDNDGCKNKPQPGAKQCPEKVREGINNLKSNTEAARETGQQGQQYLASKTETERSLRESGDQKSSLGDELGKTNTTTSDNSVGASKDGLQRLDKEAGGAPLIAESEKQISGRQQNKELAEDKGNEDANQDLEHTSTHEKTPSDDLKEQLEAFNSQEKATPPGESRTETAKEPAKSGSFLEKTSFSVVGGKSEQASRYTKTAPGLAVLAAKSAIALPPALRGLTDPFQDQRHDPLLAERLNAVLSQELVLGAISAAPRDAFGLKPEQAVMRRLQTHFSRIVSKLAEDLSGWPVEGDDEWDMAALLARSMDRRPLRSCRQARERAAMALIIDVSGSCLHSSEFFSKIAALAVREKDVDLFSGNNGRIEARWDTNLGKFVRVHCGRWPFHHRTVLFFGDHDGEALIMDAATRNRVTWFSNEKRERYLNSAVRTTFHGHYITCQQDLDLIKVARSMR